LLIKNKKKLIFVVGARPNFIKIAPLIKEIILQKKYLSFEIVHTGQHFNDEMSNIFFRNLKIPNPKYNLNVGRYNVCKQISKIIFEFDAILKLENPNYVILFGDVNSSLACSIAANKNNIKIVHVEAGLRSFDRTMPEENNRIIIDQLSDILFTHSISANNNLLNENIEKKKIFFVGNVMIDTLKNNISNTNNIKDKISKKLKLKRKFIVVTLHRPSNVDNIYLFEELLKKIDKFTSRYEVYFVSHPRTSKKIEKLKKLFNIKFLPPQSYFDFLTLIKMSEFIITDSGGIQEEAVFLKKNCFTLRLNTERPVTLEVGSNFLINPYQNIYQQVMNIISNDKRKKITMPKLWDGNAAKRIIKILIKAKL
jgi:UDP-N-acetylglucosamine 2-epimerase (non-hydrolysing)